jgi:hypothetical protein
MIFYLIVRVLILIYINPGFSELPVKISTTNFWLPKVKIKVNMGDCRNTTRHRVITAKIVIYSCYSAFILSSLEAVGRGWGARLQTVPGNAGLKPSEGIVRAVQARSRDR